MYVTKVNEGSKKVYYLFFKSPIDNKMKRKKVIPETENEEDANFFKANFIIPGAIQPAPKEKPLISLSAFIERLYQYLSHNVSDSTYALYFTTFESFNSFIGKKYINEITALDIENFKYHLSKRMQKITVNKNLRNIKAGFNIAIEKFEILEKNPASKIEFYRVERNEIQYLSDAEIEKMLQVIDKTIYKRIFLFLMYSGVRLGEALSLTWNSINFQNNSIIIRNNKDIGFTTKNLGHRILGLTEPLKQIIGIPDLNPDAYVFRNTKKGRFDLDFISAKFKEYSLKAGLKNYRTHSLRRTFAVNCIKSGVKIQDLKSLLGHSKISTTEIYLSSSVTDLQESMAKLNYGIDLERGLAI